MKKHLYRAALAVGLGLAGTTAAHAQINNNDLVLGFTSQFGGVVNDYVIDLGQIPSSPGAIDTSAIFDPTTFANTFTTSSGNALTSGAVNVGIIGGGALDVIDSVQDTSGFPSTTAPGSFAPGGSTPSNIGAAAEIASAITLGTPSQASQNSFYSDVAKNPTTPGANNNSFAGYVSNPLTTIDGTSQSLVLDLWEDTTTGRTGTTGWTYEGFIDLSLNGGNLTAAYDEITTVPEPTTYGICGLGVLLFGLRRKLTGKLV